ncbi:hypothetical protein HNQ07_004644 [Deinococcus metalli]|uniref:Uncharacterized protein n=1 Tax=Deinococcus metalli TaxID=1141878 RepID=A0A7W8NQJ5_9DEIO|nr:hypothetical protein [Deinococcus metalli]MBB5379129.1 hypothetical protein [Deinococcus metalli]GHF65033.1 hypothetical protein GCM10017781_46030 [Deinococcus metalli]
MTPRVSVLAQGMVMGRHTSEPYTPQLGSVPSLLLAALDPHEARPLPDLPTVKDGVRATAVSRLQTAGYITRHPGRSARALWTITATGLRARERVATGLTLRQARVLLLVPAGGATARQLSDAYNAAYDPSARELMYQTIRILQASGLLEEAVAPARWVLTALGRTRRADARQRMTLSTSLG